VITKVTRDRFNIENHCKDASLTVEAALVLPLFLYFMIAFLYFIQIFILQEQIQSAITKMGLNIAKSAYIYNDFLDIEEVQSFDDAVLGNEYDIGLQELTSVITNETLLKVFAMKYLDKSWINHSCIKEGFNGISFSNSKVLFNDDYVDIVVRYYVKIPIKIFQLEEMHMIQRVRLRAWTGYEVAATYTMEEENGNSDDTIVYVTETGSVYHKSNDCSHIKLSVREVYGLPNDLRNDYGSKYDSCEACCTGKEGDNATYYITSDGTKYHTRRDCSKIKRNVREMRLSEVGSRTPCKRCSN
jgi:hypothetical protein